MAEENSNIDLTTGLPIDGDSLDWLPDQYGDIAECMCDCPYDDAFLRWAESHAGSIIGREPLTLEEARELYCKDHERGACCRMGECIGTMTENNCQRVGGFWKGKDAPCSDNVCKFSRGACCAMLGVEARWPNAECTMVTGTESESAAWLCHQNGGAYQGDGSNCDDGNCGKLGCCCKAYKIPEGDWNVYGEIETTQKACETLMWDRRFSFDGMTEIGEVFFRDPEGVDWDWKQTWTEGVKCSDICDGRGCFWNPPSCYEITGGDYVYPLDHGDLDYWSAGVGSFGSWGPFRSPHTDGEERFDNQGAAHCGDIIDDDGWDALAWSMFHLEVVDPGESKWGVGQKLDVAHLTNQQWVWSMGVPWDHSFNAQTQYCWADQYASSSHSSGKLWRDLIEQSYTVPSWSIFNTSTGRSNAAANDPDGFIAEYDRLGEEFGFTPPAVNNPDGSHLLVEVPIGWPTFKVIKGYDSSGYVAADRYDLHGVYSGYSGSVSAPSNGFARLSWTDVINPATKTPVGYISEWTKWYELSQRPAVPANGGGGWAIWKSRPVLARYIPSSSPGSYDGTYINGAGNDATYLRGEVLGIDPVTGQEGGQLGFPPWAISSGAIEPYRMVRRPFEANLTGSTCLDYHGYIASPGQVSVDGVDGTVIEVPEIPAEDLLEPWFELSWGGQSVALGFEDYDRGEIGQEWELKGRADAASAGMFGERADLPTWTVKKLDAFNDPRCHGPRNPGGGTPGLWGCCPSNPLCETDPSIGSGAAGGDPEGAAGGDPLSGFYPEGTAAVSSFAPGSVPGATAEITGLNTAAARAAAGIQGRAVPTGGITGNDGVCCLNACEAENTITALTLGTLKNNGKGYDSKKEAEEAGRRHWDNYQPFVGESTTKVKETLWAVVNDCQTIRLKKEALEKSRSFFSSMKKYGSTQVNGVWKEYTEKNNEERYGKITHEDEDTIHLKTEVNIGAGLGEGYTNRHVITMIIDLEDIWIIDPLPTPRTEWHTSENNCPTSATFCKSCVRYNVGDEIVVDGNAIDTEPPSTHVEVQTVLEAQYPHATWTPLRNAVCNGLHSDGYCLLKVEAERMNPPTGVWTIFEDTFLSGEDEDWYYTITVCDRTGGGTTEPPDPPTGPPPPPPIIGCTDRLADNYDPSATEPCFQELPWGLSTVRVENSCCVYPTARVPGCPDPNATNYNPKADGCIDGGELPGGEVIRGNKSCCIYPPPKPPGKKRPWVKCWPKNGIGNCCPLTSIDVFYIGKKIDMILLAFGDPPDFITPTVEADGKARTFLTYNGLDITETNCETGQIRKCTTVHFGYEWGGVNAVRPNTNPIITDVRIDDCGPWEAAPGLEPEVH